MTRSWCARPRQGKWANGRRKPVLLPSGEQAMDADEQPLELERFIMDQPIRYRSRYGTFKVQFGGGYYTVTQSVGNRSNVTIFNGIKRHHNFFPPKMRHSKLNKIGIFL